MLPTSGPEFVPYWRGVRQRTRRLLPLVPPDRFEWAPDASRWTFGDIFRHLAGIERWMYAENVQDRPSRYPGHGPDLARGPEAVAAYLDRCHEEACEIFGSLTPEQLAAKVTTPAGTPITNAKWLRAIVEHEAHHRGQLYLMLGLLGVTPPQLYGLTEEEVHRRSPPST
jgi:uncharacterized damage-inducible protein DinB